MGGNSRTTPRLAIVMSVSSVLLTLAVVEVALRFTSLAVQPLKLTLPTSHGSAQCYRTSRESFPIDLSVPAQRAALLRIAMGGVARAEELGATRCVAYDTRLRRLGTHPERLRRAAIVGDSFAYGEGVSDTETVGAALAERKPEIGFSSLAFAGADVFDVGRVVKRILNDPSPPTDILYFYNLNDVQRTEAIAAREAPLRQRLMLRFEKMRTSPNALERRSALYRIAERAWFDFSVTRLTTRTQLSMYFDPLNASGLDRTLAAVAEMAHSSRARGVGFWFVVYPWMVKDLLGRYPFEPIHRRLMAACATWGARCIDGANAFIEDRSMTQYVVDADDAHPNAAAHRKMAEYLSRLPGFLADARPEGSASGDADVPLLAATRAAPSSALTVEDVAGEPGQYVTGGPMFSLDVKPSKPGLHVATLRAKATPCGDEWPEVGVYVDDTRADVMKIDTTDWTASVSATFAIERPAVVRFVYSNAYEDDSCRRMVYVDTIDVTEAR